MVCLASLLFTAALRCRLVSGACCLLELALLLQRGAHSSKLPLLDGLGFWHQSQASAQTGLSRPPPLAEVYARFSSSLSRCCILRPAQAGLLLLQAADLTIQMCTATSHMLRPACSSEHGLLLQGADLSTGHAQRQAQSCNQDSH